MNVAIIGRAGSGKSTSAEYLATHYGMVRCSIANPTKRAIGGWLRGVVGGSPKALGFGCYLRTADPLEIYEAFRDEARPAAQAMANVLHNVRPDDRAVLIREIIDRAARADVPVVVDDCRMPWEADAFLAAGWYVLKIERPGDVDAVAGNTHVTEALINQCRYSLLIPNDGTLSWLHCCLDYAAGYAGLRPGTLPYPETIGALGDYRRYLDKVN